MAAEHHIHQGWVISKHRIYTTSFASIGPQHVAKAENKRRTKADVDEIVRWQPCSSAIPRLGGPMTLHDISWQ